MRILHISLAFLKNSRNLYNELAAALVRHGHTVSVLTSCDGPADVASVRAVENGVDVVRVRTPRIYGVGALRKGFSFLALPFFMKRALRRHFRGAHFDLILCEAPPVTMTGVVRLAKRKFGCPVYLMQKDIFPQNAVDLGLFSRRSPAYFYFRRLEKRMLKTADFVGCMSQGNVDYLRRHNPCERPEKFEIFPNTRCVVPPKPVAPEEVASLRARLGIPAHACVCLFAGNIGLPQYDRLLRRAIGAFKARDDVYFLVLGSGTHAAALERFIEEGGFKNARFLKKLPSEEYQKIAETCDVGLVILDPRFTIPNYPSKMLSYMMASVPILAATDTCTDVRALIESEAKCGLWVASSDEAAFFAAIGRMAADAAARAEWGANGRRYFEQNFDVERSVRILENKIQGD